MEASTEEKDQEREEGRDDEQQEESSSNGSSSNGQGGVGRIEEVQGVVIEAVFDEDELPEIYNALEVEFESPEEEEGVSAGTSAQGTLVFEVQQHLGDDRVRCVAMDTTDGLARGQEIRDTGGPITVPVGDVTKGHVFNMLGDCLNLEEGETLDVTERWASTARPRRSTSSSPRPRCSRPASRSSTC